MKYFLPVVLLMTVFSTEAQQTDSLAPAVYHWNDLILQKEGDDLKRSLFKGSTTTLSNFEVASYTLPPSKGSAPYFKHDDLEELMILKEGTFKITINGKKHDTWSGQHCICDAG